MIKIKEVHNNVAEKIARVKVSEKFTAILGAMLDQHWTNPRLTCLCATSDGFVLGEQEGDLGFNEFLGALSDLERNCRGVAEVAELTPGETNYFLALMPVPGEPV